MNDDQRFEDWWQNFAAPQVESHLMGRRFEAQIRQGAKQAWDAALTWKKQTETNEPKP